VPCAGRRDVRPRARPRRWRPLPPWTPARAATPCPRIPHLVAPVGALLVVRLRVRESYRRRNSRTFGSAHGSASVARASTDPERVASERRRCRPSARSPAASLRKDLPRAEGRARRRPTPPWPRCSLSSAIGGAMTRGPGTRASERCRPALDDRALVGGGKQQASQKGGSDPFRSETYNARGV